jgi:hypothetical protein
MIAKGKAAALVVAGGALLGGCAAQPPSTYYQPVPSGYFDPAVVSGNLEQQWRASLEQQNLARQYQADNPPVTEVAPPRRHAGRPHDDDGPVISGNPSAPTPAPAPQAPSDDPDCVGFWRICHFL